MADEMKVTGRQAGIEPAIVTFRCDELKRCTNSFTSPTDEKVSLQILFSYLEVFDLQ